MYKMYNVYNLKCWASSSGGLLVADRLNKTTTITLHICLKGAWHRDYKFGTQAHTAPPWLFAHSS